MPRSTFLAPLKPKILKAYEAVIPERTDVLKAIGSRLDNIDIDHRRESFSAIPVYGIVNVGWWALESIWCLAYCVNVWGPAFKRAMEDGETAVSLDRVAHDFIGMGLFNWTVDNLALEGERPWLHSNAPDYPYDAGGEPFDETIRSTESVFLGAVGWILLHELAHIDHGHGNNPDVRADEEEADRTATEWLFKKAPFGTVDDRFTGLATALYYMWIREDRMATPDGDHPPVADRIEAAIQNAGLVDNAWCLCVFAAMMDAYEQRSASATPVARLTTFDTCKDYVDACLRVRRTR